MANIIPTLPYIWASKMAYGFKTFKGKSTEDKVEIRRSGDNIIISSNKYTEYIEMKDKFLDNFTGDTWEARVRRIKRNMEHKLMKDKTEEEFKDLQLANIK